MNRKSPIHLLGSLALVFMIAACGSAAPATGQPPAATAAPPGPTVAPTARVTPTALPTRKLDLGNGYEITLDTNWKEEKETSAVGAWRLQHSEGWGMVIRVITGNGNADLDQMVQMAKVGLEKQNGVIALESVNTPLVLGSGLKGNSTLLRATLGSELLNMRFAIFKGDGFSVITTLVNTDRNGIPPSQDKLFDTVVSSLRASKAGSQNPALSSVVVRTPSGIEVPVPAGWKTDKNTEASDTIALTHANNHLNGIISTGKGQVFGDMDQAFKVLTSGYPKLGLTVTKDAPVPVALKGVGQGQTFAMKFSMDGKLSATGRMFFVRNATHETTFFFVNDAATWGADQEQLIEPLLNGVRIAP